MDERQRTENFERMRAALEAQGWRGTACTISVVRANVMAFATAGPVAAVCVLLFFIKHPAGGFSFTWRGYLLFFAGMILSVPVHEFLHGLTWSLYCKNGWRSIHIGVLWKKLTPYCCCMEPLSPGAYLLGGLAPFVVLGLGSFAAAMAAGSVGWLWLSAFNMLAAGGDTTIALMLLLRRPGGDRIIDHPTACGFWAFSRG
ncbi:MAG: DUF3267 domain-containing protein [Oscillospiraceae bacterium]|nr:DUF3267 domain-containing protein [Oscillospiraceae bacterium]